MEFKAGERMMLLSLLSGAEGDVTMLRIVREAQNKLGFTEGELEALNIRQEGPQVLWTTEADQPVEIDIGKTAHKLIADKLERLNAERKLTFPQLALYERFVEDEDIPSVKERTDGKGHGQRVPNRAERRAHTP